MTTSIPDGDAVHCLPHPEHRGAPAPIVSLDTITRYFSGPPAVNVLRGLSLTVNVGEYLAIVGSSGSGKSTLLNIIGLLDRASTGSYLFEGTDVAELTEDERTILRAHAIGFVFQSFQLMPTRTALENVMLAGIYAGVPQLHRERAARDALARVGLSHRLHATPSTLSGGEQQRCAIARAVCVAPRLLLADEPTGNLDHDHAASIMQLFSELNRDGLTIVMITHDPTIAAAADRTARMSDGNILVEQ